MDIYRQAQFPKFAIVICEPPKDAAGHADIKRWKEFLLNIPKALLQNENTERIHENVWLIQSAAEPLLQFEIVQLCRASSIPVRVLFLEEPPTWLKYPPDAKAMPVV